MNKENKKIKLEVINEILEIWNGLKEQAWNTKQRLRELEFRLKELKARAEKDE